MRFNFRKIAATLASTAMLGSTIGLSMAASYPAPFVDGGTGDVAVIYGSDLDVGAVGSITNSLSGLISTGSSGVPEGGDFVQLDNGDSNRLNMNDAINGPFTGNVDEEDLANLLAEGTYTADDKDDFAYEQKIVLGAFNLTHFRDSDYEALAGLDDRTPTIGFKIPSGNLIMNYTLDFTSDAESTVTSGDLDDFEGSDIPLLGKNYYVSDAANGTDAVGIKFGKFTLLDSANRATVQEGETVSLSVGDKTYQISIDYIDSDSTALSVNGEITDDLAEGQSEKISDGSYVGIRDVKKLEVAGELGSVDFSIGAGKLEITSGSDIKLNDVAVSGVKASMVRTTADGGTQQLDKIVVEWVNDEEVFIGPNLDLVLPGFESVKFSMNDFVRNEEEEIKVVPDGDDSIELSVPIKDGTANFNILFTDTSGNFTGIGKSNDERLATDADSNIRFIEKLGGNNHDTYFVATYNTTDSAESFLLKATAREDDTDGRNETTITNVLTGSTCADKVVNDECSFGDVSLTINEIYVSGDDEWVNFTAGSNVHFNVLYTTGGLKVYLPVNASDTTAAAQWKGELNFSKSGVVGDTTAGYSPDSWYLFFDEEDKDDNKGSGISFNVTINDNSDEDLQVSQVHTAGSGGPDGKEIGSTNAFEAYVPSDVATKTIHYTNPDQDYAEILYPAGSTGKSESYAEVFLSEVGASSSSTGGGLSFTDDEVASVQAKNLIVVGGTCVNTVAQTLFGLTGPACSEAWTAETGAGDGEWIIQTFANPWSSEKVATLVAGYNQGDTANAASYLTTQDSVTTDVDSKMMGTTSTSASVVTV